MQACNLIFEDPIKKIFPRYSTKDTFWKALAVNALSGGLTAAITLVIVHPLVLVYTRLATDVGNTQQFSGIGDCVSQVFGFAFPHIFAPY
jgi:hypothetical protein